MSSFFTLPASQRKRKRPDADQATRTRAPRPSKAAASKRPRRDESISGSGSSVASGAEDGYSSSGSSSGHADETGAERRLRLAERYLENVKSEVQAHGFDAEEIDRDLIAARLQEDAAESKGRLYRFIAGSYDYAHATATSFRGETDVVTGVAACLPFAYTVSKDRRLTKWQLAEPIAARRRTTGPPPRRRPTKLVSRRAGRRDDKAAQHHTAAVLCVAASADGRFVVSGGADARLIVWSAEDLTPLKVFSQHRDSVTALALQRGSNRLYSAAADRTIKTWGLNELAYIETLFGHQDSVVDVAALAQERCLTAGARDRSVRLWKVVDETQLVFRGGSGEKKRRDPDLAKRDDKYGGVRFAEGSIDRVALVDDDTFVTGSDNGSLCLWSVHKKKPVFELPLAHGCDPPPSVQESFAETDFAGKEVQGAPRPRWITALKAVPFSDLVVSGSWDGCVRVWRVTEDKKKLEAVAHVQSVDGVEGGDADRTAKKAVVGEHSGRQVTRSGRPPGYLAPGVINDLELVERGEKGRDGLCIVAAIGKEHRLGRWKTGLGAEARNGAVVLEVPLRRVKKRRRGKTVQ